MQISVRNFEADITGFADEHALILYVYLTNYDDGTEDSVLTVCLCFLLSIIFAFS